MKWETYRKLTPEQREEWRFKYRKEIKLPSTVTYLILILLSLTLFAMITVYGAKEVVELTQPLREYLKEGLKIAKYLLYAWIGEVIVIVLVLVYHMYKEHKWLKSIGVK